MDRAKQLADRHNKTKKNHNFCYNKEKENEGAATWVDAAKHPRAAMTLKRDQERRIDQGT